MTNQISEVTGSIYSQYVTTMHINLLLVLRRTYVGAMLGRVLESIKTVGSSNPVILLDEVEKMVT